MGSEAEGRSSGTTSPLTAQRIGPSSVIPWVCHGEGRRLPADSRSSPPHACSCIAPGVEAFRPDRPADNFTQWPGWQLTVREGYACVLLRQFEPRQQLQEGTAKAWVWRRVRAIYDAMPPGQVQRMVQEAAASAAARRRLQVGAAGSADQTRAVHRRPAAPLRRAPREAAAEVAPPSPLPSHPALPLRRTSDLPHPIFVCPFPFPSHLRPTTPCDQYRKLQGLMIMS